MALSHEDKKDVAGAMGKAIANKVSKVTKDGSRLARAAQFEKEQTNALKGHLSARAKRIKSGGFKDENDYFANVNPFTGKRAK